MSCSLSSRIARSRFTKSNAGLTIPSINCDQLGTRPRFGDGTGHAISGPGNAPKIDFNWRVTTLNQVLSPSIHQDVDRSISPTWHSATRILRAKIETGEMGEVGEVGEVESRQLRKLWVTVEYKLCLRWVAQTTT